MIKLIQLINGTKSMRNLKNSIFLFMVIACTPNDYKLSFNINNQELVECNGKSINYLFIQNDSILENGKTLGNDIQIEWQRDDKAPCKINFQNLPGKYSILFDNKNNFKLIPNTSYTLSTNHSGQKSTKIKIWTNGDGRIYKTSNLNCK